MFVGIDHGTTAIRFATSKGQCFEIARDEAARLSGDEILGKVESSFGPERIDLLALTYSMGDGLCSIVRIGDARNRGLVSQEGAGKHVGGGTKVFDAVASSGFPAILLPGIHRGSDVDPRLNVFSHGMSPEKVGLAYAVYKRGIEDFIISDASSNTVTFAVLGGKIVGAIDAPIFAPGLMQGPLDVEAIRDVDSGKVTANQAFSKGGILRKLGQNKLEECSPDERLFALESLALFAAMEIGAMEVLARDLKVLDPSIYLAGSPAGLICERVSGLLGKRALALGRCEAAVGCAMIAEDVFLGKDEILGIKVDGRVRGFSCHRHGISAEPLP
jgi:putative methanogenesis marker protein 12